MFRKTEGVPSADRAFNQETCALLFSPASADLCDVVLLTSDGQKLPACRAMLAIRSPYFKKLFFSDFKESEQKEVSVSFTDTVMKLILEFAYSGRSSLTERITTKYEKNETMIYADITTLVNLTAAFDYCEMMSFRGVCLSLIQSLGERYSSVCCTAIEAIVRNQSPPTFSNAKFAILNGLCKYPRTALKVPDCVEPANPLRLSYQDHSSPFISFQPDHKGRFPFKKEGTPQLSFQEASKVPSTILDNISRQYGILCLSEDTLEEVLKCQFHRDDQEYLFQSLYFWATRGKVLQRHHNPSQSTVESNDDCIMDNRWQQATSMAQYIQFKHMRVMFLKDYVKPTGWLTGKSLEEVLWHHALTNAEMVHAKLL